MHRAPCKRTVSRSGRIGELTAMLTIGAAIAVSAAADEMKSAWTQDDIAALFPAPLDSWSAGDVAIEERDTIVSGLESFALAPLAETATAGVSVRLKATRAYRSGDRAIAISIDTEDIETAAMVDAVDAVASAEDDGPDELVALGEELLAAGVTALSRDGYRGVSAETDSEAGRAFKIGSAGVVSLECAYPDCGADLDVMVERLDLFAIAEFAAFDHRR
ncbi:hypothetical protein PUV54_01820 [Hyphococcus flavus]|uniref:Uncharacterized protein n=1 Tax=Hyphococcus flavus TaxID=1866326 RepID=A0AAE9ZE07_9PROT|nr:hypothetical protein [Hyphococcus flavus]WDI31925.1 hypothetical protein PUV54_01820 [Hyphococcus flavus]